MPIFKFKKLEEMSAWAIRDNIIEILKQKSPTMVIENAYIGGLSEPMYIDIIKDENMRHLVDTISIILAEQYKHYYKLINKDELKALVKDELKALVKDELKALGVEVE